MSASKLISPEELAAELGVPLQTLSNWRHTGRYNLPFIKCGRLVRYRREDVDQFLVRRTASPKTESQ